MGQLFQGVVSNCSQGVLSTTSGKIDTIAGNVRGAINTIHSHYTTFDIGNMGFKLKGDYPLRDGDEVVFYAAPSGGYYEVQTLKNFTRNYFIRDRFGSLWLYYFGLISGILSACMAIGLAVLAMAVSEAHLKFGVWYGCFANIASLLGTFGLAKIAKHKYKQNKVIENCLHLKQAEGMALTQLQSANQSKPKGIFFISAGLVFLGFGKCFGDSYVVFGEWSNKRNNRSSMG